MLEVKTVESMTDVLKTLRTMGGTGAEKLIITNTFKGTSVRMVVVLRTRTGVGVMLATWCRVPGLGYAHSRLYSSLSALFGSLFVTKKKRRSGEAHNAKSPIF